MTRPKRIVNLILGFIAAIVLLVISLNRQNLPPGQEAQNGSQAILPNSSEEQTANTTLFFAGDIMLSRNVHRKISEANDPTLPFQKTAAVSANADIAFANLESPFNTTGTHFVDGSLIFNADPNSVTGLTVAGFDVLSTANNHALDQGLKGLDLTIDWLKQHQIIPVGTFPTTGGEFDPGQNVISKNKIAFGFLSYSYTAQNDGGKTTSPYIAGYNDLTKLKQDILGMRGHYSDVVIVNMHAGTEYTREPTQKQIDFAHAAIDAGADLVTGEHPHWIQTVEQYKGKWIFYSLGNFVFDQMWSQETREGLTVLVTYKNSEIIKIELRPVIIEDYSTPRWANSEETIAILQKINLTSPILFNQN